MCHGNCKSNTRFKDDLVVILDDMVKNNITTIDGNEEYFCSLFKVNVWDKGVMTEKDVMTAVLFYGVSIEQMLTREYVLLVAYASPRPKNDSYLLPENPYSSEEIFAKSFRSLASAFCATQSIYDQEKFDERQRSFDCARFLQYVYYYTHDDKKVDALAWNYLKKNEINENVKQYYAGLMARATADAHLLQIAQTLYETQSFSLLSSDKRNDTDTIDRGLVATMFRFWQRAIFIDWLRSSVERKVQEVVPNTETTVGDNVIQTITEHNRKLVAYYRWCELVDAHDHLYGQGAAILLRFYPDLDNLPRMSIDVLKRLQKVATINVGYSLDTKQFMREPVVARPEDESIADHILPFLCCGNPQQPVSYNHLEFVSVLNYIYNSSDNRSLYKRLENVVKQHQQPVSPQATGVVTLLKPQWCLAAVAMMSPADVRSVKFFTTLRSREKQIHIATAASTNIYKTTKSTRNVVTKKQPAKTPSALSRNQSNKRKLFAENNDDDVNAGDDDNFDTDNIDTNKRRRILTEDLQHELGPPESTNDFNNDVATADDNLNDSNCFYDDNNYNSFESNNANNKSIDSNNNNIDEKIKVTSEIIIRGSNQQDFGNQIANNNNNNNSNVGRNKNHFDIEVFNSNKGRWRLLCKMMPATVELERMYAGYCADVYEEACAYRFCLDSTRIVRGTTGRIKIDCDWHTHCADIERIVRKVWHIDLHIYSPGQTVMFLYIHNRLQIFWRIKEERCEDDDVDGRRECQKSLRDELATLNSTISGSQRTKSLWPIGRSWWAIVREYFQQRRTRYDKFDVQRVLSLTPNNYFFR